MKNVAYFLSLWNNICYMLRKIMKKCKKNYTNIILFLTFMLLWKYIQAQRMEAIVVERMKFMIQHIYIIIAQMKIMLRNHAKNIFAVQLEQKQFFALVEVCSFSIAQARKLSWPNFALLFPLSSTWPLIWGGVHTLAKLEKKWQHFKI